MRHEGDRCPRFLLVVGAAVPQPGHLPRASRGALTDSDESSPAFMAAPHSTGPRDSPINTMTSDILRTAPMNFTLYFPVTARPSTGAVANLFGRLYQVLANCRERAAYAVERRRVEHELHELDDHMLADIGLRRADLPWRHRRHDFAVLDHVQAWSLDFAARHPVRGY